jgi:hypothetical protein
MNFFEFFSSNYHGERGKVGWPAGGSQLGLAAVSLLHNCLNQGHFFSKSLFMNFYDFFEFLSSEYHGEREGESGSKGYTRTGKPKEISKIEFT